MRGQWLCAAGLAALTMSGAASAETESLREALVNTYGANPTIMAQRAQLRSLDEDVALARSAGRPQISATGGLNQDVLTSNIAAATAAISPGRRCQPAALFRCRGEEWRSRRQYEGRCRSRRPARDGRRYFHEASPLIWTSSATVDRPVEPSQCACCRPICRPTRDRFEVGDLTRTDVAQSEARLGAAQSTLARRRDILRGARRISPG